MGIAGCDVVAPPDFPFSIEVKDDKTVRAIHFFRPTALVTQYWKQAKDQATEAAKQPLLCAKVDGQWFAAMKREFVLTPTSGAWSVWDGDRILILPLMEFFGSYDKHADTSNEGSGQHVRAGVRASMGP